MYNILTLNNISTIGLDQLPQEKYQISSNTQDPDAILLRSFNMHNMPILGNLKAVGRAGSGVNNIPVDELTKLGIPVFNAPGANANAVKELVIGSMLIASRNICHAWNYSCNLSGDDATITKAVEDGKKKFVGTELPNKILGVVGLGAIGVQIANTASKLGMRVIGFDPQMTVKSAWKLNAQVEYYDDIDALLQIVDFVTFHVPLVPATKNIINEKRIEKMKPNAVILNFSRNGIIDDTAVLKGLDAKKLKAYISDFPTNEIKNHPKVITLPHLGASTIEAEDNCAIMVTQQIRDYLESGNILNSINFPDINLPKPDGTRLAIVNENIPNMIGQITTILADAGLNIIDLSNKSQDTIAYSLFDIENDINDTVLTQINNIPQVLNVRKIV